jgi:hypothetical protein
LPCSILPAVLVAELREHLAKADALQPARARVPPVFVYTEGWHIGQPVGLFRKPWARACKAAGRPGAIVHDLRRSGIRNMVRAGISETVAMKVPATARAPPSAAATSPLTRISAPSPSEWACLRA